MNLNEPLDLLDLHVDAVLQVVYEPAAIVLLVLLVAGGIDCLGKQFDGELEVDMLASNQFACLLKWNQLS